MLNYIEAFLEMLSATRYVSQNTLEAYNNDLHWFAQQFKADINIATEQDINKIFESNAAKNLSTATKVRRVITIRQFFQYLHSQNYRDNNPTTALDIPKNDRSLPKTMSEEEVAKLLQKAQEEANSQHKTTKDKNRAIRLYALLSMLYASGLRISELCSLNINALQKKENHPLPSFILIKGKGEKERFVPINEESKEAIKKWLIIRNHKYAKFKNPYLFPANSSSKYVARQVVARELKALAARANLLYKEISPHVFRHAIASHMLQHGSDLRVLQKILGHSDISTTQIYTHIMDDKLYKTVQNYHPLAHKVNK